MRTVKLRDLAGLVGPDADVKINVNPCTNRMIWDNFREARRILGMICKAKIPARAASATPGIQDEVQKATCNATWAAGTAEYWTVSTDAGSVRLRKPTATTYFGEPLLRNGDTVLYMLDSAGNQWAVSDYLGPPRGTVDFWALDKAVIPPGWGLADGAGNSSGSNIKITGWMFEGSKGYSMEMRGEHTSWNAISFSSAFSALTGSGTANISVDESVAPVILPINIGDYFFVRDHVELTEPSRADAQQLGWTTITLDLSSASIVVEDDRGGGPPRVTTWDDTNIPRYGMSRDGQHAHVVNTSTINEISDTGVHDRGSVTEMDDAWTDHFHVVSDPGHRHDLDPHTHSLPEEPHTHSVDAHQHTWSEVPPHVHKVELEHTIFGLHNHIQDLHTHVVVDAGHQHEGIELDSVTVPLHVHISNMPERTTIIPIERLD